MSRGRPHRALALAVALLAAALAAEAGAGTARGPLRVHPGNPRYFMDDAGRVVFLTGSHTWASLQDRGFTDPPPAFDYPGYLALLQRHGHNFLRLWVYENARGTPETAADFANEPLPYARTGPGLARDGKPKFDLSRWHEPYFDRLRARVAAARDVGIYTAVMLFNGWSVEPFEKYPGDPWRGHPFNRHNNVNGIDGDLNGDNGGREIHTLGRDPRLAAIRRLQEAYVRKVIDTLGDLDSVLWEIGNEMGAHSTEWQYHMIRLIRDYERGRRAPHPIGMTYQWPNGSNAALFESPADWVSPGEAGNYRHDPPPGNGKKVVLADTDHLWGIGGSADWVWKSFTRGLHPIYMDPYGHPLYPPPDAGIRQAMGAAARVAARLDLAAMVPLPEVASTRFALANPRVEYLVFLPDVPARPSGAGRLLPGRMQRWLADVTGQTAQVEVDLSAAPGSLAVTWSDPITGQSTAGTPVAGGARRTLAAPFPGAAVLHLAPEAGSGPSARRAKSPAAPVAGQPLRRTVR